MGIFDFIFAVVLLALLAFAIGREIFRSLLREELTFRLNALGGAIAETANAANLTTDPYEEKRLRGELFRLRERFRRTYERLEGLCDREGENE